MILLISRTTQVQWLFEFSTFLFFGLHVRKYDRYILVPRRWERPRTIYLSYIVEACEDKSRAKSKFSYLKICIGILVFVFVFVYLFICICICVTMCENKSKAKSKFSSPEICISWCQPSENIEISLIKYVNCPRNPSPNIHYIGWRQIFSLSNLEEL